MWRERLARELGVTVTEESSVDYVQPRLLTVQARRMLERYPPRS